MSRGPRERPPARSGQRASLARSMEAGAAVSTTRPSPTASPPRSSAGGASSSSGSTRAPTCSRSSCAATRTSAAREAAHACVRFCCGIIDAVAPHASRSSRSSRSSRRSDPTACARSSRRQRLRARRRPARDRGRQAGRHRLDLTRLRGRLSRAAGTPTGRRGRAHRQPVPRPRRARPLPRRLPPARRRHLLPREDLERGQRRHPGPDALRRAPASGTTSRASSPSGARTSSASTASRASAPSSARPTRARSRRPAGCCRRRSCSCPGIGAQGGSTADVARAFTSGPASALVNASRSVIYAYRATGAADWRSAAGAEAARLAREVWSVSGW